MAMPACMSDDGRPAVFVGTMLQTGDSVALCDECMVPWAAAILNAMTGVDPTPFLQAVSEDVPTSAESAPTDEPPAPAPHDTDPDAATPDPDSGRSSNGSAGPGTENVPPGTFRKRRPRSSQPAS